MYTILVPPPIPPQDQNFCKKCPFFEKISSRSAKIGLRKRFLRKNGVFEVLTVDFKLFLDIFWENFQKSVEVWS